MKKVLIITYYWPPGGGGGVQRWLKFVKYLPSFGWQPVVYTPENPESPSEDNSLLKDIPSGIEIIKTPIWEPYQLYKKFIGHKPEQKINTGFLSEKEKPKFTEKISVWIRGNFFIPDARMFWVKPSVKFLSEYLKKNKIDAIVSTGPPHSMHLIGLELKKRFNIPWIADFRDPWTNIDFYKDLMLTQRSDRKHHLLEKKILTNADRVIAIGETMADEFKLISKRSIEVITNGYDEDDVITNGVIPDKKFSIAHVGSLNKDRNPTTLWKVLGELCKDEEFKNQFEIKLVGKVDIAVTKAISENKLESNFRKIEYMPHDEVIREQQQSQVLLLLINNTPNAKGILTGKMFEYLASKRPILCIGADDGDAARILKETNSGVAIDFNDSEKMKKTITGFYNQFKNNELKINSSGAEKFSRKNLTKELSEVLYSMILEK